MNPRTLTLLGVMLLAAAYAQAARVEVRGVGTYQYESHGWSSKPNDQDKAKAIVLAKQAAWNNFVAGLNPSKQQMIAQRPGDFAQNLDRLIIDYVILDTSTDPAARTLRTVVRVAFNDETVNQLTKAPSAAAAAGQDAGKSPNSSFTFIFMARKASAIRQFDARRTDVSKQQDATTVAADGGISRLTTAETGGSSLRKADEVGYTVESSQDLDSAMGNVFTTAAIDYVSYDDVVANCNAPATASFRDEYVNADELSPATRAAVIKAVQGCEVRYLSTGTIDTGVAQTDPVTGQKKVFVSVRAQLWDVSTAQRLPRKIGSVGPRQFSGLGPDAAVAARNALNAAAAQTAQELVDQLNAKKVL